MGVAVFFTGALWTPPNASTDPTWASDDILNNSVGGNVLNFGTVSVPSGTYLAVLSVQWDWLFTTQGSAAINGNLTFLDGGTVRQTFPLGASQQGTSGQMLGVISGYPLMFMVQVTQSNQLFLAADPQISLKGAQLMLIAPSSVVNSPGFTV